MGRSRVADLELTRLSVQQLLHGYRTKDLSPVEVTRACLAQIERLDQDYGAFVFVDHEGALAMAGQSQARWSAGEPQGRLDGIPATIKDIIAWSGWPNRRGSLTTEKLPPVNFDAPSVAALRRNGAVFLGKTTSPEFGWKAVTDNPVGDVARNPWDKSKTAGGSSGGAAVAAAFGMGPLHIGTDGGGSIRVPCSFCGLVGIKPTFGRVPAYPLSPYGTVAHIGPMTRTVEDCARMLTVLAETDSRDWYALPQDDIDYSIGLDDGIAGLRVGVCRELEGRTASDEVLEVFDAALTSLGDAGALVRNIDVDAQGAAELFRQSWYTGAANIVDEIAESDRSLLDPGFFEIATEGAALTSQQLRTLANRRADFATKLELLFDDIDLLVTPATAITALDTGKEVPDGSGMKRWHEWAGFNYPFNLSQQPAMSVPCGQTPAGLPVGLQIVGKKYTDALVLRAGRAVETTLGTKRPPLA